MNNSAQKILTSSLFVQANRIHPYVMLHASRLTQHLYQVLYEDSAMLSVADVSEGTKQKHLVVPCLASQQSRHNRKATACVWACCWCVIGIVCPTSHCSGCMHAACLALYVAPSLQLAPACLRRQDPPYLGCILYSLCDGLLLVERDGDVLLQNNNQPVQHRQGWAKEKVWREDDQIISYNEQQRAGTHIWFGSKA
eukprot:1159589-Pelagomonas_calceolata.AAC.3